MKLSGPFRKIAALTLVTLPMTGFAVDELSYDYLELRYAESEIDVNPGQIDGDGWQFNGLFEISNSLHLFAGYERFEFDDNVRVSTTVVGGGLALGVSPTTDIVLRAGFVDGELDDPLFETSDEGFLLSAGVRSLITPDIELYGNLQTIDFDDIGEEELMTVGADFYLNDEFSIGPNITWVEDTTTWSIGAKFFF
ncbi:MAG: hypothetical protein AAAFM81_04050 [Pseudomonadota bacterium]